MTRSHLDFDIAMIAAVSENGVIGNDGKIPWDIPEDLKRFRDITKYSNVVMGRKTYESIPIKYRPLPDRKNIILTRNLDYEVPYSVEKFDSVDAVLDYVLDQKTYIIGGENVYHQFIDYASELEITLIHDDVVGDTYFPYISPDIWKLDFQEVFGNLHSKEKFDLYSFIKYVRR